ncbi:hypothetical protein ACBT_0563 [Aliarcobacter cibarius]|uniref:Uncharacterized protein n=1 Tax=Aliarcobacter cibarius TaxID=255507 RepID=A0A7L5JMX6_9BACT|nr:hypothetical protein [Aliarcobacter cibarius]QKJ26517.1 hypothetical protein ACBT_0563 [Aliarcobacter cibarius]
MTKEQIMVELFEFSAPTYYKWTKKEKRKIFDLLNYAFTLEELEEFISSGKIEKMEIINNNQVLINKIKEFKENLIEKSNTFIANNVLVKIKEHYIRNNYKIDMEELKFELFNLNDYYFIECADEEFMLKLNDFDTRYNFDTNSLDSEERTLDTISSMTRYKIISYIENTPKEILEFALNFI